MARITVEDCLENLTNRFELIMLATKRARDLLRGKVDSQLDWENDKPTVLALREIAEGLVDISYLKQSDTTEEDTAAVPTSILVKPSDAGTSESSN